MEVVDDPMIDPLYKIPVVVSYSSIKDFTTIYFLPQLPMYLNKNTNKHQKEPIG